MDCNYEQSCLSRMRAFTLVELLVVIAIISVLAGMLLPALQRAQATARTVVCQSNLKQVAMWGMQYADENRGVLPHNGNPDPTSWNRYGRLSKSWWMQKTPNYKSMARSGTWLHCPQATSSLQPRWIWHSRCSFDFGLNEYLGGVAGANHPEVPKTKQLSSRVYWFADGHSGYFGSKLYIWEYMSYTFGPWMWQGLGFKGHPDQRTNFVMGDGHVESKFYNQLYPSPPKGWTGAGSW